jgi:DNA-directed RNA polymerase specialized sigma24 family protein
MNNNQLTSVAGLSEQISRSGRLATLLFYAVPPVREKRTEVSHMTSNGNQSQRIYDKATRTWYEVPEDQYKEFDRWRTNLRKREQYWGRCFCPRGKWWLCDGNCVECEFHTRNEVSLDDPLPDGEGMRGDYVPDDNPTPEEITADRDLLERLTARLHELDPDADKILELWSENPNLSDRKIAEAIGRPQKTFSDRMKRLRDEFRPYRNS